jgi:uncharacterized SAM-binding protein YcdF (DUF218 family)
VAIGVLFGAGVHALAMYAAVRRTAHVQPTRRTDVIIVLGAGWERPTHLPTPTYRGRLKHALDLYGCGFADHIIVTELAPAAEIAREYLVSRGVPADAIRFENRSTTTWENLVFARGVMRANGWRSAIVVSDGFHLWRSLQMCQELGIEAQGAATPYSRIERTPRLRRRYSLAEVRKHVTHCLTGQ